MIRNSLVLSTFLLIQLFATAQPKDRDSIDFPFHGVLRKLGGQLNMVYDGERLRIHLLADLPDKSSMAKALIKEKSEERWFSGPAGRMKISGEEVRIFLS